MKLMPKTKACGPLSKVSPTRSLISIRDEMDRVFDRFFTDPWGSWPTQTAGSREAGFAPPMDIAETESEISVRVEIPGVDPKEIDIQVHNDTLTIRGEKKEERDEKEGGYHYVERRSGSFERSVRLPDTVNAEQIEATSDHGILTLRLPKRPEAQPKQIKVDVK